jgi:NAD(P)-dependent dehydrogenase (short-subunit alcohol dehydrogenase family)
MHPEDDNALNTEEKIWDLTMQINLKGVWWGCKYAILAMRENQADEVKGLKKGGSIINTASFVALLGAATPQLACNVLRFCILLPFSDTSARYRFKGECLFIRNTLIVLLI